MRPLISCTLTACGRTKSFRSFNPWLFGSTMLSSIARWPTHFELTNAPLATSTLISQSSGTVSCHFPTRGHLAIDGRSSHTTSSTCGNQGDEQLNRVVAAAVPAPTTAAAPRWPADITEALSCQSPALSLAPTTTSAPLRSSQRAKPQNAGK